MIRADQNGDETLGSTAAGNALGGIGDVFGVGSLLRAIPAGRKRIRTNRATPKISGGK